MFDKKEADKKYYQKNKEYLQVKRKEYWQNNKDKIKIQMKDYRKKNQDIIKKNKHEWSYNKRWLVECIPFKLFWKKIEKERIDKEKRKKRLQATKNWRDKNKDHIKQYEKIHRPIYYQKNKERITDQKRLYNQRTRQKQLQRMIRHLQKYGFPFKLSVKQYKYALFTWSKTVKKQYDDICMVCGSIYNIHSHHIFYKKDYPELSLNVNNGISLCVIHHREVHDLN